MGRFVLVVVKNEVLIGTLSSQGLEHRTRSAMYSAANLTTLIQSVLPVETAYQTRLSCNYCPHENGLQSVGALHTNSSIKFREKVSVLSAFIFSLKTSKIVLIP